MGTFDKTFISTDSPVWLGFQHFLITGILLCASAVFYLTVFGFYFSYGINSVDFTVIFIGEFIMSVFISSWLFKRRSLDKIQLNKILKRSTIFALTYVFIFLFLFYKNHDVIIAISAVIILPIYYGIGHFIFNKSHNF